MDRMIQRRPFLFAAVVVEHHLLSRVQIFISTLRQTEAFLLHTSRKSDQSDSISQIVEDLPTDVGFGINLKGHIRQRFIQARGLDQSDQTHLT